ncbi:hypothetical protein AB0B57_22410 [Micromonospora sp. NPDC049101]|uniref:hypothetical protein n=1 Tax=Micromonospora sp. NPDC049101 TaxID=3155032 RepID=UPI0033DAB869
MAVEFVVTVQAATLDGQDADTVKLDAVGGRLATHEVAMRVDGPRVWVTVTVQDQGPVAALGQANAIVLAACDAVGEPVEWRAATVYNGDEYARQMMAHEI